MAARAKKITEKAYSSDNLKSPNGKTFEANDINYLVNNGYTRENAIKYLAKTEKYASPEENKSEDSSVSSWKIKVEQAAQIAVKNQMSQELNKAIQETGVSTTKKVLSEEEKEKVRNAISSYSIGLYANKESMDTYAKESAEQIKEIISNNSNYILTSNIISNITKNTINTNNDTNTENILPTSKESVENVLADEIKKSVEAGNSLSDAMTNATTTLQNNNATLDNKLTAVNNVIVAMNDIQKDVVDKLKINNVSDVTDILAAIKTTGVKVNGIDEAIKYSQNVEQIQNVILNNGNIVTTPPYISETTAPMYQYLSAFALLKNSATKGIKTEEEAIALLTSVSGITHNSNISKYKEASQELIKISKNGIKTKEDQLAAMSVLLGATGKGELIQYVGTKLNSKTSLNSSDDVIKELQALAKVESSLTNSSNISNVLNIVNTSKQCVEILSDVKKNGITTEQIQALVNNVGGHYGVGNDIAKYATLAASIADMNKNGSIKDNDKLNSLAMTLGAATGHTEISKYMTEAIKIRDITNQIGGIHNTADILNLAYQYVGEDKLNNLFSTKRLLERAGVPSWAATILDASLDENGKFNSKTFNEQINAKVQEMIKDKILGTVINKLNQIDQALMANLQKNVFNKVNEVMDEARAIMDLVNVTSVFLGGEILFQTDIIKGWQEEAEKVVKEYEQKLLSGVLAGLTNITSSIKFNF